MWTDSHRLHPTADCTIFPQSTNNFNHQRLRVTLRRKVARTKIKAEEWEKMKKTQLNETLRAQFDWFVFVVFCFSSEFFHLKVQYLILLFHTSTNNLENILNTIKTMHLSATLLHG